MNMPFITASTDIGSGTADMTCSVACADDASLCIVSEATQLDIDNTLLATCAGCGRVVIELGVLVLQ